MIAAILKEPEHLDIEEVEIPVPGNGEILLKVEACAICGTDVKTYRHGHKNIVFPRITGHEVTGTVAKTGKNVKSVAEGTRVAVAPAIPCGACYYCRKGFQSSCENLKAIGYHYNGGFAEYMLVPGDAVRNGCVNTIPQPFIHGSHDAGLCMRDKRPVSDRVGRGYCPCYVVRADGSFTRSSPSTRCGKVFSRHISREAEDAEFTGLSWLINQDRPEFISMTGGRMATRCRGTCTAAEFAPSWLQKGSVNYFGLPKDKPFVRFNSNLRTTVIFVVGTHGSNPILTE